MFIRNTGATASASSARSLLSTASLAVAVSLSLLAAPQAFAQSSGTQATDDSLSEVVVTARRVVELAGVTAQDAAKSRITVSSEYLESQATGQTLFASLNQVPGVNFTNSDPYGSSGGNLRIRGFDGSRVSVTFDGVPLNDSGNYALFTNQMLDPELINRVDVNLGTTDADSPTASATGGTVAYQTVKPRDDMGGRVTLSVGQYNYQRAFGMFDTGRFGPWGTAAWIAASATKYDKFKGPGELDKKQFNARIYQSIGDNGDFVSLAFHYNKNRNAFYRTTSFANYAAFGLGYENLASCTRDAPTAGVADNENLSSVASTPTLLNTDNLANTSSCTNFYGVRINPSDTANIRVQSLFHLTDKLRLAIDPSMQYVLANGGGTTALTERPATTIADRRIVGNTALAGFDLNGDGDTLDTVRFYTPNNTNTYRLGINASLIWDINETQRVRLAYTLDRARHRQTGEWGYMGADGTPENVFGGNKGAKVPTADGSFIRGRDRYSIAELNQVAVEYRGKFMDDKLVATIGVRAPHFKRELNQYCYSQNGASAFLCTTQTPVTTLASGNVLFAAGAANGNNPEYIKPYSDTVKFDKVLPNVGFTFSPWDNHTLYFSFAKGLSAPRTDNLYIVRRLADNSVGRGLPESETTNSFDLGWRYNTPNVLASVALWKSDYKNRIVSAFDPIAGFNVDRNVGDVKLQGIDMQIGWRVTDAVTLSSSASYNKSELQSDLQLITDAQLAAGGALVPTKGKTLVETPKWTFSARGDFKAGPNLRFGIQGKRVGDRFGTDINDEVSPAYTVWDVDARYSFNTTKLRALDLKLNVTNLLDEAYFGNISSGIGTLQSNSALPRFQGSSGVGFYAIGAPRTIQVSLEAKF